MLHLSSLGDMIPHSSKQRTERTLNPPPHVAEHCMEHARRAIFQNVSVLRYYSTGEADAMLPTSDHSDTVQPSSPVDACFADCSSFELAIVCVVMLLTVDVSFLLVLRSHRCKPGYMPRLTHIIGTSAASYIPGFWHLSRLQRTRLDGFSDWHPSETSL